jgi:hypothetical protein
MALMQDDVMELLHESGADVEDAGMTQARSASRGWQKRWLVVSLAIFLVAYGGMAALLHKRTQAPASTTRGARLTTLTDDLFMEERTHACDTFFDLQGISHRNFDNKGPDSGPEGLIMTGAFAHGTDAPVPLEMHFHALTPYTLPASRREQTGITPFQIPPGNMAKIRMANNRETKVQVELVVPGGHELYTVPQLAFSFFDLDGHADGCEEITVEPANDVVLAQNMAVSVNLTRREEGIVKFSNTVGYASIPRRIDRFDDESQRRHSAEAIFYQVNTFNMTLHTGECGDRAFAFIGRANVQCGLGSNGGDPPPVDIQTAAPPPVVISPATTQYCLLCWIHGSLSFIPPCSDAPAWWARICE